MFPVCAEMATLVILPSVKVRVLNNCRNGYVLYLNTITVTCCLVTELHSLEFCLFSLTSQFFIAER